MEVNSCDWTNQNRLRKRSQRNYCYFEESEEEDCGGMTVHYSYNILEKMKEERFMSSEGMVLHFENGKSLNMQYLQANGFSHPMIFHDTAGLGLKLPPSSFTVTDIKNQIGPMRMVDVMDCSSQETLSMCLDQFCKYYEDHAMGRDDRLLNVISLEFSHTPLDPLIEPPRVVKELDWVNLVWPKEMRESQTDPTNDMRRMMYPKVQKYCLMSVAGCYTDFHLDFGGTSVWYHVLKGEKVFFLVPPSPTAYCRFEEWQKHGQQEKTFFPDIVEECAIVHLKEGDTLLLPSGWIHGVYTPRQSLVFGGNFLNSLHISRQLEVSNMEKQLKVHGRFCYPYYSQIHWYVIEKYSQCLTDLANSKEPEIKRTCRIEDYSLPPGKKWVESVSLSKFPVDKFRMRSVPIEKDVLPSPYIAPCEREGLKCLIQQMKDGLFLSDAPADRVGNPHSLLSLLETQLQLRTLCSQQPNGITVLSLALAKEEKRLFPCKMEAKKQETNKQGDYEVFDIIKEFFGGDDKPVHYDGGVGHVTVTPQSPVTAKPVDVTSSNGNRQNHVNKLTHLVSAAPSPTPLQLSHAHSINQSAQNQVDSSKMMEDLMKSTFGDKPHPQGAVTNQGGVANPVNEDQMTSLLSELTADHVIQSFLTPITTEHKPSSEMASGQVTPVATPSNDHVIANHMIPSLIPPPTTTHHVTSASSNQHMRSNPATPTIDIPSLPNIPSLTPDHMTQLLDQVSALSGIVLPNLNKTSTSDDDSLSKIVSSSLELLSPSPSSTPLPFTFTSLPSAITSSMSPLTPAPNSSLSLTSQLDRGILSSLNPGISQTLSLLPATSSTSITSPLTPIVPNSAPSKPTSLLLSGDTGGFSLTTPIGSTPSPGGSQVPPKELKRRLSKSGGVNKRQRSGGSKTTRKQASRKSRCGKCDGCKRSPCGECKFCLDSVRMGGFGKLKKACIQRKCSNMMDPKSSVSIDSPSETFPPSTPTTVAAISIGGGGVHTTTETIPLKKELVKTIKRERSTSSTGSLSGPATIHTPTLADPTDPTVEVLSMGFANVNNGGGAESTEPDLVLHHPDTFGLNIASHDPLNTGGNAMVTDSVTPSDTRISPLMRINDTFCSEDPLFNASSIPSIHAQVLSSPTPSQLSTVDLFPFSSHTSMIENDFTLHLSEDNV